MDFCIRTVTYGVQLGRGQDWATSLQTAHAFLSLAKARFEGLGYTVQTVRIATNPFEEYCDCSSEAALIADVSTLAAVTSSFSTPVLLCIGPAATPLSVSFIPALLAKCAVTCSAAIHAGVIDGDLVPDDVMAHAVAEAMNRISAVTPGGEGNFNFAAVFNCPSGIPYFPAGYHTGPVSSFAIGLENPNILFRAFASAGKGPSVLVRAGSALKAALTEIIVPIEAVCQALQLDTGCQFGGVDTSIAPSPTSSSVVQAYESLGMGAFGGPGSLAISACITQALKSLPVKMCGYCGIMLPPLEDTGLVSRAAEGRYTIKDLLMYSSVCGIGLDTVPIPGDSSPGVISALLQDVCILAFKLQKPLSCRLFPVPGKSAGDVTTFTNPHLCNGPVFAL